MTVLIQTWVEQLKHHLPEKVYLHEVNYDDSIPVRVLEGIVRDNGSERSQDALYELELDWCTWDAEQYYINEALDDMARALRITKAELIAHLEAEEDDWRDELRYEVQERNASTPIADLARYTDDVVLRLEMYSNYDCINSAYCEGKVVDLNESYLADVLRVLRINPKDYADVLDVLDQGYECRDVTNVYRGRPLLSALDVYKEHQELSSGPALLTFVFKMAVDELLKFKGLIQIPAGAKVGFFSSAVGAGSIWEAELSQAFTVDLANQPPTYSEPTFGLFIDDSDCKHSGYSIEETYGMSRNWLSVNGSIYPDTEHAA
ncbi:hypothetical protein [Hydromonas duriensis]|uniref:Uncharacterized protein n=1 Tax=Hydromonas duriensis TaxID=1527608 RepID=A0A4R6Y4U1_9BURK|nr:hypothetical protein [Hydromonas duriensis]TDR30228.1 hypothetical protein DFR44_1244 [Hydromonas duriensis]